jgi:hypothetical protein
MASNTQLQLALQKFDLQLKKNLLREIGFLKSREISPSHRPSSPLSRDGNLTSVAPDGTFLSATPRVLNRRILMESLNSDAPSLSSNGGSSSRSGRGGAQESTGTSSQCSS